MIENPPTGTPNPDFDNLRKYASYLQTLNSIGPDDPRYQRARATYAAVKELFQGEVTKLRARNESANAADKAAARTDPDLGGTASARIGLAKGLGFSAGGVAGMVAGPAIAGSVGGPLGTAIGALAGLGMAFAGSAAVKPIAEASAAISPGGATAGDVAQQWDATTEAHPTAETVGELAGGVVGGLVGRTVLRAGKAVEELKALRLRNLKAAQALKVEKAATAMTQAAKEVPLAPGSSAAVKSAEATQRQTLDELFANVRAAAERSGLPDVPPAMKNWTGVFSGSLENMLEQVPEAPTGYLADKAFAWKGNPSRVNPKLFQAVMKELVSRGVNVVSGGQVQ